MEKADIGRFVLGCCIGAVAGLLLAPQSGQTTRAWMTKAAADGKNSVQRYGKTAQGAVVTVMEHSKDYLIRQKSGVTEAIKRSAEAYRRTG